MKTQNRFFALLLLFISTANYYLQKAAILSVLEDQTTENFPKPIIHTSYNEEKKVYTVTAKNPQEEIISAESSNLNTALAILERKLQ